MQWYSELHVCSGSNVVHSPSLMSLMGRPSKIALTLSIAYGETVASCKDVSFPKILKHLYHCKKNWRLI